jgi:osomolarity two-component system sensor histidine kinase TcsA
MDRIFVLSSTPTIVLDKDLEILVVSNSWRKLANFDPDQLRGKSFLETSGDLPLPTDGDTVAQLVRNAVASRAEQKTEPLPGNSAPSHWRIEAVPIFDGDDLLYVAVQCQDVTEQVQKAKEQSAQLASAETFRTLVSTLRDYAMFMLDTNGCITT